MEEIQEKSITRCLTELKNLDKRILKATKSKFITYKIGPKPVEDITAKANLQKVLDLIDLRSRIKAEVMKSNAITSINIAGNEMTVAEAIETKNSILYQKEILINLRDQLQDVRYRIDQENEDSQRRLDRLLEASVGKDSSEKEIKAIVDGFEKRNFATLDNQIDIENKISDLTEEIDNFESEVDLCLSESNSTTFVEV